MNIYITEQEHRGILIGLTEIIKELEKYDGGSIHPDNAWSRICDIEERFKSLEIQE